MNEFVLVLTLCTPGIWANCADGKIKVERITHIPSQTQCLAAAQSYNQIKYIEGGVISAICIPQTK